MRSSFGRYQERELEVAESERVFFIRDHEKRQQSIPGGRGISKVLEELHYTIH